MLQFEGLAAYITFVALGASPVTVIVTVAVLPLEVVAVIVAVPAFLRLTLPSELTAATESSELLQVTRWLASEGVTVALSVSEVSPDEISRDTLPLETPSPKMDTPVASTPEPPS